MNFPKPKFKRIAVLYGGISREREISITSGKAVVLALKKTGIAVDEVDVGRSPEVQLAGRSYEAVFLALHGTFGEDGGIQTVLEKLGIPYSGSGPEASRLAFYKDEAKKIFQTRNIPTPDYRIYSNTVSADFLTLEGPWVLKPVAEGSSIGVEMFSDKGLLDEALRRRVAAGEQLLLEKRIVGRELTVGILSDKALPIIELKTSRNFYDFQAKYASGDTQYLLPAPISKEVADRASELAVRAHLALGLSDFSRVDIMLDEKERPWVLEINSIPGFTDKSLLPKAARFSGMDFTTLCVEILNKASLKNKSINSKTKPLAMAQKV